ncbi:acetyl-CoA carboxylase biotin carboxylase subunit [Solihabitans fulvus]|nr:biotin carboxylase N-terminal domain-containing protein [Solihabitans fulvus]
MRTMLICNRGEIAVRLVRACRDLGVRSVVAHSAADRDGLAVQLADDAVCIGPAPADRSYRNVSSILYAAARVGADAVHPGYGFLAEDPRFVSACEEVGLAFVGPPASVVAGMGDKIAARAAMREAGVPTLPGTDGPVGSLAEASAAAEAIGYPVIVKAAAGGGGRGIAVAMDGSELAAAVADASGSARSLFGDDRVYLERYVVGGRHVEVQVLADAHGTVVHLGERDCSVQRRRQKLVEESPSTALDDATRQRLLDAAVRGCERIGYRSAGTLEFIVDRAGSPYFLEMNTRLQVEHPVSELRSGVDIVTAMIAIADGDALPAELAGVAMRGHAIEVRLNAEDPARQWAPSAGRISRLRLPAGPGVRVDTHLVDGAMVPPFYDSLLAKIIVHAPDRPSALRVLRRALGEVECHGITTNLDFHLALLETPEFVAGTHQLDIADSVADRLTPAATAG